MMTRILLLGGILGPLVYLAAVCLGAAIRPGYSHIAHFVSELIESGAPNRRLLNPLFAMYNLLTGAFAVGVSNWVADWSFGAVPFNAGRVGAIILLLEALFGFLTVFFPQDRRGTPMTRTGTLHILLAGLSSLATMGAILMMGFWFRRAPGMQGFSLYSFISLAVVFVSGGLAAYSGVSGSRLAGLLERITIGAFLQWMLVVAVKLVGMT